MPAGEAPKSIHASIYIDGKPAIGTTKELSQNVQSLRRDLDSLKVGSDEYNAAMEKWKLGAANLQLIKNEANNLGAAMKQLRDESGGFFSDYKEGFGEIKELVEKVTIGTIIGLGVRSAIEGIKDVWNEAEAAYTAQVKAEAQLDAVLKSTGGVAGQTKEGLDKMSSSMSGMYGVQSKVITKGQEMLLTFTNVRGKIFQEAMPAIVDMTAALNQGTVSMDTIQKTSEQVGKALNDPIKGMAQLRKVGVDFSDAQKAQIKNFMDSNRMMDAQKVILAALSKEFGGVAQAMAQTDVGTLQKQATVIDSISEGFGRMMIRGKAAMAGVMAPFLEWLDKAVNTSLPEKLKEEEEGLNSLVGAIISTNQNQTIRNQLIAELQAKYPDFLGNIKAEDAANELLTRRLSAANDQYRLKIFMAANEDKLKTIQEDRTKAIKDEADARERVAKASGLSATELAKLTDAQVKNLAATQFAEESKMANMSAGQGTFAGTTSGSSKEAQARGDLTLILDGRKRIEDSFKEEADLMGANAVYQNKVTQQRVADIDKEIAAVEKLKAAEKNPDKKANDQTEIDRLKKEKDDTLGIVVTPKSGPSLADQAKAESQAQKAKELYASLIEQARAFNASELTEKLAANDKEVKADSDKYDAEIAKQTAGLKKLQQNKKSTQAERTAIQANIDKLIIDKQASTNAIRERQEQDLNDQIVKFQQTLTDVHATELQKQLDKINEFYDAKAKAAGSDYREQITIEAARQTDITNAKISEAKSLQDEIQKLKDEGAISDADKQKVRLNKIAADWDQQLVNLKKKYSLELQATQAFKDAEALILAGKTKAIADAKADDPAIKKQQEQTQKIEDFEIEAAQKTANEIFSITSKNRQADTDAQIKTLEAQKTAELNVVGLTQGQKATINATYAQKEAEVKLQAWKADQLASEEQIVINGALAVVKALAQVGPLGSFVIPGIVVETAVQLATAASQKPPAFAGGGLTDEDPAGYVGQPTVFTNSASGRPIMAGEAGKEWIAPNWMVKSPRYANVIGMLESARQDKRAFAAGGSTGSPIAAAQTPGIDLSPLLAEMQLNTKAIKDQKVILSMAQFNENNRKVAQIKDDATY
jgi:hypothetical protein